VASFRLVIASWLRLVDFGRTLICDDAFKNIYFSCFRCHRGGYVAGLTILLLLVTITIIIIIIIIIIMKLPFIE
jgi:hypothetical protein